MNHENYSDTANSNVVSSRSRTGPKPTSLPKRYRRSTTSRFSPIATELTQKGQGAPNQRVKPYKSPYIVHPVPTGNEVPGSLEQYVSNSPPTFSLVSKPQTCTEIPEGLELKGSKPHRDRQTTECTDNILDQIELGPLVDGAITKPILRRLNLEWARAEADSNVDVGLDESSSTHQSSHNIPSMSLFVPFLSFLQM